MLSVEKLGKSVGNFAAKNIGLDVCQGDYFVLLGASGAGKSLFLELVSGLTKPDTGCISLHGNDITNQPVNKRGFAVVFQGHALFPHMSVFKNIAYGLPKGADKATRVAELAEMVGAAHLLDRQPTTLSGGEAQRVALARALATNPQVLLLDEPLASLDRHARAEIRQLLRDINHNGQTIVHVTHDYEEALALAKNIGVMDNGQIVQTGTPEHVFKNPKTEFVARFTGVRNFFKGKLHAKKQKSTRTFVSSELEFNVLSDEPEGAGSIIIRTTDVTISLDVPHSSARNIFKATINDIIPAPSGAELVLDIGQCLIALITTDSVSNMGLKKNQTVWAAVKASSIRFIKGRK